MASVDRQTPLAPESVAEVPYTQPSAFDSEYSISNGLVEVPSEEKLPGAISGTTLVTSQGFDVD